jgi:hypothetical protein
MNPTQIKEEKMGALEELKLLLRELPPGNIEGEQERKIRSLLFDVWDLLEGSDATSLSILKLHRMEKLEYEPPSTIKFEIERHGSTVVGSVYADVHLWTINLADLTASCNEHYKKRVVGVRSAPLKVKPLAERVVKDIVDLKQDSDLLEWKSNGKVKVRIAEIIPATNQQTTIARRKRFRQCVEDLLKPHGWKAASSYNLYEKERKEL